MADRSAASTLLTDIFPFSILFDRRCSLDSLAALTPTVNRCPLIVIPSRFNRGFGLQARFTLNDLMLIAWKRSWIYSKSPLHLNSFKPFRLWGRGNYMLGFKVTGQFSCQCEFILSSRSSLWRTNSLAKFPSVYLYVYLSCIRLDQVDRTPFPE